MLADPTINLAIGETLQQTWVWTSAGEPVDMSGKIPTMTVREADGTLMATLGADEITLGSDGTIVFNWPNSILTTGAFQYDLWIDRKRIALGIMNIEASPTVWS